VDKAEKKSAELTEALAQLEQCYDNVLEAFGSSLGLRDAETEGHSQRVTALALSIGKHVSAANNDLPILARAAFLHDIGKIAIPDVILRKPRALNDDEKKMMRSHCELGCYALLRIPFLRDAADIVHAHHEFFDGTGYPRGLRGDQIPLGAGILSVANALDAMLSDWPYRKALPWSDACREIRRGAGTQFDPEIVEVFFTIPVNHWTELREKLRLPFLGTSAGFVH
jgi:cyclic di-GMP phosphodiesterase